MNSPYESLLSDKKVKLSPENKRLIAKITPVPQKQKDTLLGVIAHRMKTARLVEGLTQKELGLRIGLSEDVASARINRYEKMTMQPGLETIDKIGVALNIDPTVLYIEDDLVALFTLIASRLSPERQALVAQDLEKSMQKEGISPDVVRAQLGVAPTDPVSPPLQSAPTRKRGRKI